MQPIVFVLGKPGCGKGTVCTHLANEMPVVHFSAGELLRAEVKTNSADAQEIQADMLAGRIVRPQITVSLLRKAMEKKNVENPNIKGFIIDGFPRELEQFEFFKQQLDGERCFLLHLDCSDENCFGRIHGRKEGRADDNDETVKNRLANFATETMKVIQQFREKGRLIEISSNGTKLQTCQAAQKALLGLVGIRR